MIYSLFILPANQCYNVLMAEGKNSSWKFTGDEDGASAPSAQPTAVKPVVWTASEYIEHEKTAMWYVYCVLAAAAIIGGMYLVTRDVISVLILGVLAVAFIIFAARKPQVLEYRLESNGITIGPKFYPINMFRSFAVIEEGAFRSISLLPMKRFMPSIALYYAPTDEQAIMDAFGKLLPQEIRKQDPLDKFMNRIRF